MINLLDAISTFLGLLGILCAVAGIPMEAHFKKLKNLGAKIIFTGLVLICVAGLIRVLIFTCETSERFLK